jgi:hypothetical protein
MADQSPEIARPRSGLFYTVHKYEFVDALNTLNFGLLMKLIPAERRAQYKGLAPLCNNTDRQLEWRKALFVQTLINLLNAGSEVGCLPNPDQCADFAQCICQEVLFDELSI